MARKQVHELVLNNLHLANKIAEAVINSSNLKKSLIIETGPGRGFITQKLLANDASRLLVLEKKKSSDLNQLKLLFKDYPSAHLHLLDDKEFAFDKIRQICQCRQLDDRLLDKQSPVTCLLSNHPAQDHLWLNCIINDLLSTSGLFSHRESEAFILFNDLTMKQFLKRRESHRKVFLRSLFSHEKILDFDMRNFSPQLPIKKAYPLANFNPSLAHLVRLSANEKTYGQLSPDRVDEYRHFLRQALFRSNSGLVQFIDKFFPGLGPRIINCGFNSFMRIQELTPDQYVKLFNECISWPEYKTSYFAKRSGSSDEDTDEVVAEQ